MLCALCIVVMTTVIHSLSTAPLCALLVTLKMTGGCSFDRLASKMVQRTLCFTFCPKNVSVFKRMCLKNDFMMYNLSSHLQLLWSFPHNKTIWYIIQLIVQRATTCQGPPVMTLNWCLKAAGSAQNYLVVSEVCVIVYRRVTWCNILEHWFLYGYEF